MSCSITPRGTSESDAGSEERSICCSKIVNRTTSSFPSRAPVARVVVADNNELARAGMRSMLGREPGLEIVGEASNGRQALDLCCQLRPDLVLLEIRMPEMDGLSVTKAIRAACPVTKVIILTMHETPEYHFAAMDAGAAGYLLKDITRRELIAAIRDVLSGKRRLADDLPARRMGRTSLRPNGQAVDLVEPLTPRETQVLGLLTQGLSNREIGSALQISMGTAKIHVERILGKLGATDRTQAAVRAARWGLVQ
jgi:DNA-binding NarL/FixJ family response regulator